ncbi:hypothetical protein FQZ97_865050 [compost metagenome]
MKNSAASIQIFSPIRKENWVYQTKNLTFSTLEHGLFAIDAIGLDWSSKQSVVLACVESTAKLGFFRVVPWFPGRSDLRDALIASFPDCRINKHDVFGYFEPSSRNLGLIFTLWKESGAWGSGVWQIGGCLHQFSGDVFNTSDGELGFFLQEVQNIGCVLSLEEMEQSTLLTRTFDQLPDTLGVLEKSCQA